MISSTGRAWLPLRILPSLLGLSVMAAVVLIHCLAPLPLYHRILTVWGIRPFALPFLDTDGLLASWDCSRLGFDVLVGNPCDLLGRVLNYSPLWSALAWLPLGRADRIAVGLSLDACFLVSLALLPAPSGGGELALRSAATVSTMVAFALERGNVDLAVFIVAVVMALAMAGSFVLRTLSYTLATLAALLKYYPAVLLLFAVRERPRRLLAIGVAAATAAGLFLAGHAADVRLTLRNIPTGSPFGNMFGASNVLLGIRALLRVMPVSQAAAGGMADGVVLLGVAVVAYESVRLWRATDWTAAVARMDEARRSALIAGALLLVGCFGAGQNIGYRGVFFLLVLPGLWTLSRDAAVHGWLARHAPILVVLLMWGQAWRQGLEWLAALLGQPAGLVTALRVALWLARELGFWAVMLTLALTLAAAARSQAARLRFGAGGAVSRPRDARP